MSQNFHQYQKLWTHFHLQLWSRIQAREFCLQLLTKQTKSYGHSTNKSEHDYTNNRLLIELILFRENNIKAFIPEDDLIREAAKTNNNDK